MSLTAEWRGRVDHWQRAIQELFFTKLGEVALEGAITREQLTPAQALKQRFRSMPVGTPWGSQWEYGWFKGAFRLPREAAGRRIVLQALDAAQHGEARVLVNGQERGGRDTQHSEILLAERGTPGRRYDILMEIYAGHGPLVRGVGPVIEGVKSVPEPPATQRKVGAVAFGIWQEEAYQAWLDVKTLFQLRDLLDPNSLRVAEIDAGLRDYTTVVDLELPLEQALESIRAGRKRLTALLACRNGSTAPLLYCIGHSHLDVAWLWPLQETERKCARTFATQLGLMDQYPEYRFLQSQPHLYDMVRRRHPELYQRIKAAVRRGQWLPEGGMWVEPDTNLSGGEALIRQFMHGKRFFREELGVESELMWLPDVFGYSGALPQIMAGCGIKWFSTMKIFWTYNGADPFPLNTFWWEGIDGTRVLSHIYNDYNSHTDPKSIHQRWTERVQKDLLQARLVPFGHGDGGGGATREHLELLRRERDLEGLPRCTQASPVRFFREQAARAVSWPVYVGELYFAAHRGTYTTQAKTKKGNRQCEVALREAELWGGAAQALAGFRYPFAPMDKAWKGVLLNQFHDIIPGSSIARVYAEAEVLYERVLDEARRNTGRATAKLIRRQAGAVTVFNSLSWSRHVLAPLPEGFKGGAVDGVQVPAQRIKGVLHAEVTVPACGWTTVEAAESHRTESTLKATSTLLENSKISLRLNTKGEISRFLDKESSADLAAAPMNAFRMYKDVPRKYDAWDIDSTYVAMPVPLTGMATVKVVCTGPLVATLRVTRQLHKSTMVQEISLRRDSRRVDFKTIVDWREKHKLLKVAFPSRIHANEALHEIQFGHLARPNHASRPFDSDRFEVCNHKWSALVEQNRGVAVLNDCKYGLDVDGGSINLTLLRAAVAPDMRADLGRQEFTYSFYSWNGAFFGSGVVQEAYDLNTPVVVARGEAGTASLVRVSAPNIIVETVKPAEDRSGDVIIRVYESMRAATDCDIGIEMPFGAAFLTNMLEEEQVPIRNKGNVVKLSFRPFEIKTIRLTKPAKG